MRKGGAGRPLAGKDESGRPVAVSREYPKLTVRISPGARTDLDLVGALEGRGVGDVIERSVAAYIAKLPAAQQKAIQELRTAKLAGAKKRG